MSRKRPPATGARGNERMDNVKIFSGTANPPLAGAIAAATGKELSRAVIERFPDGEQIVKIEEDVRGRDVFIIQPTCPPGDENLFQLAIFIDCARRASAGRITAVIPYFGYARQDRKDEGRVPITAKLVANILTVAGTNRVLTVDLHAAQIQGFFDIPVDHLYAGPLLSAHYKSLGLQNACILSPDPGSIKMAQGFARRLGMGLAIVDKRRVSAEETEMRHIIGSVKNRPVIIVDDMITTAGTISQAALIAREHGATGVHVGATHAIFCGDAYKRLKEADVSEIAVTDTVLLPGPWVESLKIKVLSVADMLGEAIRRIHRNESISAMFS